MNGYRRTRRQNPVRPIVGLAGSVAVLAAALTTPSPGADAPAATGTAPATGALSQLVPIPATRPTLMPVVQADTVERALDYSADERIVLSDVADDNSRLNHPALYLLLRRAAMLPDGTAPFDEAEQPNPKDLWKDPRRYRGRLVRVAGLYAGRQTDLTATGHYTPTRWWGTRKAWLVDIHEPKTGQIVLLVLPERPPRMAQGQRVRFAGLFYKRVTLRENRTTGDPRKRHEYVVIVGKFLDRGWGGAGGLLGGISLPAQVIIMVAVILGLLVGFVLLKRTMSRPSARRRAEYRPLRFEDAADDRAEADGVDEELRRQVGAAQTRLAQPTDPNDADHQDDSR